MSSVVIDFEKVCRLCLREDDGCGNVTSIYERQDIEDTIRRCVQIEVSLGCYEPTNICASCMLSLDSWNKFKALCDNTNAFLQQYIQDRNETDLNFNPDIANLGTLGFTPSQMSDLSFGFLENDSLWNNSLSQQWSEIDPPCPDSPIPKYTKKIQPPEDLTADTISGEECIDMALSVLSKRDDHYNYTKAHWWNPKAISMKKMQKENEKPALTKGIISNSLAKYNRYIRKAHVCNLCSKEFIKFNDLIQHDLTVHADMPMNFNCKKCGKLFLSKERLEVHEMAHREKLFECQLCQKKFTQQKTLNNHLNVHIGSFICKHCGFKAQNMYNLKVHESTHSSVKDHCCQECDKYFSTLSSLRRHDRLIHKKFFLFRCDQCDYSTIQPSNLKHHKSIHTPQTFMCDHCGSCFKNQDLFTAHLKRHEGLQFNCALCDKMFKKKSSLREHLSSSHELGPNLRKYQCDVCEQLFKRNRALRNHKNKCCRS